MLAKLHFIISVKCSAMLGKWLDAEKLVAWMAIRRPIASETTYKAAVLAVMPRGFLKKRSEARFSAESKMSMSDKTCTSQS